MCAVLVSVHHVQRKYAPVFFVFHLPRLFLRALCSRAAVDF